jgi:ribonuclease P protein component
MRLRRDADFRRVFEQRCRAGDEVLLVYASPNGLSHPRLGMVVSRKVGSAVRRNRWKRILREAFRLQQRQLPTAVDLVVVPRPEAEPTMDLVQRSLLRLARQAARKAARKAASGCDNPPPDRQPPSGA